MTTTDIIVLTVILLIVGGAVAYIIKAKKSGKKCIGCPDSCCCTNKDKNQASSGCGNCGGGCHCHEETK